MLKYHISLVIHFQELLLFLLDGLHEDLNRITNRTYVEQEDNDNLSDVEAAKLSWNYHKKLNESIIVELFQVWLN